MPLWWPYQAHEFQTPLGLGCGCLMDPYQTKLQPAWFGQFGGSVVFKLQLLCVVRIDLAYGGSNVCLLSQASPCKGYY